MQLSINMQHKRKTFPLKLWELVNECRLDSALRWADDGHSFYIFESELSKMCLGKENKLFFTRQPKSFVRQLHLYGFKKINRNQFKHPNFQRDDPDSVYQIRRGYRTQMTNNLIESFAQPRQVLFEPNINESLSSSSSSSTSNQSLMNYTQEIEQPPLSSSICSLCVCAGCSAL